MRILTMVLLLTILIWCSTTMETCNARKGKHWRQNRATTSVSLWKKKGKGHTSNRNHHGHTKSKPKTPSSPNISLMPPPPLSPKVPMTPPPPPSPNIPLMPPPPPSPKVPLAPPPSSPKTPLMPPPPSPQIPLMPPSPKTPLMPPPSPSPSPKAAVPPPVKPPSSNEAIYNVLEFGAIGDGTTDDTKAFQAAWAAACTVEASTVVVPLDYIFLVGPISFSGYYCQANILLQLDGTIIAPTNSNSWGKGLLQWLEFTKLRGFTIRGKGIVDGRGSVWWQNTPLDDPIDNEERLIVPLNNTLKKYLPPPINSELNEQMPSIKPTAVRFYGSFNVTVTGITIQNSPQCHLKFDNCMGVSVYEINVSSPGDSPNTDGIHLQNSQQVLIHSANLACGDDCISIQTGCSNIYVHNVKCGPGHGISIGSLGKDNSKACVSNITIRDVIMQNTMNGVRIKTWQGGAGSVQGVLFSNIQVSEVQLPIVIDQYYCDKSKCKNQTSAVSLTGITYEKIRGTYTVKPVHFACSDSLPCIDVTLNNIELKPIQEHYHLYDPFCWQTFGELSTPTVPPIDCLQLGKPASNRILSDHDYC